MLITLGDLTWQNFRKVKPLLLLTYLALEGPTPRRQLRALLWPQAQQPDSSLRVALHLLRKHDPRAVLGDDLVAAGVPCDAAQLLALRGQAALDAYSGAFLHGVPPSELSAELEEWAETQRARLTRHVQAEALALAESSRPGRAAQLAEQVFRLPGAAELDPDALARLLALSVPGSPLEAELRAELHSLSGVALPEGRGGSEAARPAGRMVGRAAELDALLAWAARPGAWLALVSGPGGIGKSTLARELLRELALLGSNVSLVDAERVESAGDLLVRLAQARAPGQAVQGTWAGLGPLLGPQPLLLLDGVDDLPDLPGLLVTLRAELPQARWVLTGRRHLGRLGHQAASPDLLILPLGGLEVPVSGADLPEIAVSSAVMLFAREAARVRRGFRVQPENAALIAGLVRRLMGHPLALALAASWLRVEGLEQVYARVLQDAATLHSPDGDGDGRRGLMLVARRSWLLLSEAEQHAALRLSVCPDLDPADAPALGVPDALLDALLAHSFLEPYLPGSERLRLYPALTGILEAQAQAEPQLAADARAAHARHYLGWFARQTPEAPAVDAERGNLRRAVGTALAAGTLGPQTLDHLLAHYDRRGLHSSGVDLFAALADAAEDVGAPAAVQAAAQIACMWLALCAGRLLDAQTLAARFLQGPLALDAASRMKALNTLAGVRGIQGQWQAAADLYRQALALAEHLGDQGRAAFYRTNMLANLLYLGTDAQVRREVAALQALWPALPEQMQWVIRQRLLEIQVHLPGADVQALQAEMQAISEWAQRTHDTTVQLFALLEGSRLHLLLGQLRPAEALMKLLRTALTHTGNLQVEADLTLLDTRLLYAKGRTPLARRSALRALHLSAARGNPWELAELVLVTAEDLGMHDPQGLKSALTAVAGAGNIIVSQRRRAREALGQLTDSPSPEPPAPPEAPLRDQAAVLDQVAVRAWLQQRLEALHQGTPPL